MADTIPDISISNTLYSDINTLSGIAAGTAIVISNKSTSPMLVQISVGQPAADNLDGEILNIQPYDTSIKLITAGENTIWAKSLRYSNSDLSVQENA